MASFSHSKEGFCFSIDVERDYRADRKLSTRGIDEGLPIFLDKLRSHRIPFDLMISGEVADRVPREVFRRSSAECTLGCHGQYHSPGYLNRFDAATQEAELRLATQKIASRFGAAPRVFRAPNFSANGDTIRILEGLGYRVDSSVLPGRLVRKWRILTLVDHRAAPVNPYAPDPSNFPAVGASSILEVPVTPNPMMQGGPIGLGFLHSYGPRACLEAIARASARYIIFLAHSWEMVSWTDSDPVAPWVRSASNSDTDSLDALISLVDGGEFVNLDRILLLEGQQRASQGEVERETKSSR